MHALEGVTVLDFGQYLAGPYGPMILGDLGANVIKVEPVVGDGMRMVPKPFVGCQRGKRAIALDLKHPDGLEIAYRLVDGADVVHHNMTKGTAARLKLDYDALRERKPDLIYCNTFAYGDEGPLSHFGGLDPLYQASGGLEYEAGAVHTGNAPLYLRLGMCDTGSALQSVLGVVLALYHRRRTGEGQYVTTSLLNAGAVFSSDAVVADRDPARRRPRLDKELTGTSARYRLYRTHDGWIQVAAVKDAQWDALLASTGAREPQLEDAFRTRTSRQWKALLDAAGVPCEIPVDTNEGETFLCDDEKLALGLVAEYEHPLLGRVRQFGQLFEFSDTPGRIGGPPPLVGEHTREILAELGYDEGDAKRLKGDGVVYYPEDDYRWPI